MPSVDSIVSVQIEVSSVNPALTNFGVPLVLAFHTVGAGGPRVRSYPGLQEALDDGHSVNGSVYAALKAIFSQSPTVPLVKVGRRATANRQSIKFTPTDTTTGKVYTLSVTRGGVTQTVSYTVLPADTATIIATALKTAIDALSIPSLVATVGAGFLTLLSDADGLWTQYSGFPEWLSVEDTSTATGLVADLAAVTMEDPGFYGLCIDVGSKAAIQAVAAVIETQKRLFVAETSDTANTDPGSTTDTCYVLKSAGYQRTFTQFQEQVGFFVGAGLMAQRFTAPPGSDTWAFKTLRGMFPSNLNTTKYNAVIAKNGGTYTTISGVNVTMEGKMSGGEYADIMRGIDWLQATMQQRIFALFLNNAKIPYTDPGIETVGNEVAAQLKIASQNPHNLVTPDYVVSVPKAASVPSVDKLARILRNVKFSGTLQGAIHYANIEGVLVP